MLRKIATVPLVGSLFLLLVWSHAAAAAGAGETDPRLAALARAAVQGGPAEAGAAIESLRREGPAGMEAALALGSGEAVDRVCGVRDCADIRLFWYTDLDAAKAAARATGKPILSLRLLGRLDEELSCANSRFFRTVYYNNREINQLLRERFVLHWRSVRPVPRVTIDFGDGTRLERTLTGNSIHYVLDSQGRLMEALPGLSGPEAFRNALQEAERASRVATLLSDAAFVFWTTERHQSQLRARSEALGRDLEALSPARPVALPATLTASKSIAEDPMLQMLRVMDSMTDDQLRELARLRRPRIRLDPASRAFLLRKHGVAEAVEEDRLVASFEETVALDEVINQYRIGPRLLTLLSDPQQRSALDLEAFNERVYEEIFETPLSDPWLGLAPEEIYVALPASMKTAASQPER